MLPSAVNDTMRAMFGAIARWYEDVQGNLVTAGSATAYTLATSGNAGGNGHAALADIGLVCFRAHAANTGADPTLAVDGLTAKTIKKSDGSALAAGDIALNGVYFATFNVTNDQFHIVVGGDSGGSMAAEGRLTLTSGVPVLTSDVTAATTVYYTPYTGDKIALYDGSSAWATIDLAETSLSLSGLAADSNFDIFGYNNSGALALESLVWTNDTTRATALTRQDGVLVKSGATTRRYLGTIRTTSTTGQTQTKFGGFASGGGEAWFGLWNAGNRVAVSYQLGDTDNSWTYSGTTHRASNNSSTMRVSCVRGLEVEPVTSNFIGSVTHTADNAGTHAIGLDSTTSAELGTMALTFSTAGITFQHTCSYTGNVGLGFHYLSGLESTNTGASAVTFYGDNGSPALFSNTLTGVVWY